MRTRFFFFFWILPLGFGIIFAESCAWAADSPSFYDARGKRDPFVQLVTASSRHAGGLEGVETADELSIEGVVYDPRSGSVVIVNGTLMKEGEELGGVKVMHIKPEGVVFSVHDVEVFKSMYPREEDRKKA